SQCLGLDRAREEGPSRARVLPTGRERLMDDIKGSFTALIAPAPGNTTSCARRAATCSFGGAWRRESFTAASYPQLSFRGALTVARPAVHRHCRLNGLL